MREQDKKLQEEAEAEFLKWSKIAREAFKEANSAWKIEGPESELPFDRWVDDNFPEYLIAVSRREDAETEYLKILNFNAGPLGKEFGDDLKNIAAIEKTDGAKASGVTAG